MGFWAIMRCSPPTALARLTAIWLTCTVRPLAVSAATAAESVSRAMADTQMRASGFLSRAASTMAARLPLLPPMKTASGAGRSERAAGASPSTRTRFRVLNFSRLALMSAQPSGLHSTA